jgi:hypothetical protein
MALAVLLFVVGQVEAWSNAEPTSTAPASSPSPSAHSSLPKISTPATLTPAQSPPASAEPSVAPGDARSVARAFVAAWARPYDRPENWLSRVRSMATEPFGQQLGLTDPARVPATSVMDEGRVVSAQAAEAKVRVATDNGPVLVQLKRVEGAWLVDAIAPAE